MQGNVAEEAAWPPIFTRRRHEAGNGRRDHMGGLRPGIARLTDRMARSLPEPADLEVEHARDCEAPTICVTANPNDQC